MAGSSTKGSSKSPKRPRKGKATAAPETEPEGTSKRPKRTRQGKAAAAPETESVDFNNEDYNKRSPERTELLIQIKEVIDNALVSPVFWACCQLADMNCLQDIAKSPQQMILLIQDSLALIAVKCEFLEFWAKSR
jgi:hypothetical protein